MFNLVLDLFPHHSPFGRAYPDGATGPPHWPPEPLRHQRGADVTDLVASHALARYTCCAWRAGAIGLMS